jgi:hypothetical protein
MDPIFWKWHLCQCCAVKLHASFSQVSQFRILSQLLVKKPTYMRTYWRTPHAISIRNDCDSCWTKLIRLISSLLLCNNSVTSIDHTQLSLYTWVIKEKWATLTIHIFNHIQSHSVFNCRNASRFSVPWVLFLRVLMFVQQLELHKASTNKMYAHMHSSGSCEYENGKMCGWHFGISCFYDITIVLFHVVQFHICTEKIPVNPRAEAYVGFMRTRTKRTRGQENRTWGTENPDAFQWSNIEYNWICK